MALDLDGTVLAPDLSVSPITRRALQAAMDQGVVVTLATGRMLSVTACFAADLGITAPLICYQGAMVADAARGEILYHRPLPLPAASEALKLARQNGWASHVYVNDELWVDAETPELARDLPFIGDGPPRVVGDLLTALNRPPTKILFSGTPESMAKAAALLRSCLGHRVYVTISRADFAEVANPGCSKGVALAWLADRLGISQDETLAAGDGMNDAEMIAWAGVGVAMGSAPDQVKRSARFVTADVAEDGVARALERFVL